ncbi:hypothetical protein HK098_002964 [Nowakowskiella sp. JEL0407]|nr:hypothetical protein HK098_002964 [Nowakowskiella sp. JEL0407]
MANPDVVKVLKEFLLNFPKTLELDISCTGHRSSSINGMLVNLEKSKVEEFICRNGILSQTVVDQLAQSLKQNRTLKKIDFGLQRIPQCRTVQRPRGRVITEINADSITNSAIKRHGESNTDFAETTLSQPPAYTSHASMYPPADNVLYPSASGLLPNNEIEIQKREKNAFITGWLSGFFASLIFGG